MASIINKVMFNPVNKETLVQKLEKHPRPENFNSLKIKKHVIQKFGAKCSSQPDPKISEHKRLQGCILKAVGAISKVTNALLESKTGKNLNTTTLSKNLSTMVHDCIDSLALLSQVNADLEQNRHDHIAYCPDKQYHALRKNVPANSEFLFGDDLPKRIMNVTANKKLFSTSTTSFQSYNSSFKSSKNLG